MRVAFGLAALMALACLAGTAPRASGADIYRCVGGDGVAHFSNAPTSDCFQRIIRVEPERTSLLGGSAGSRRAAPVLGGAGLSGAVARHEGLIAEMAARYSLGPALIKAVIQAESNFDPRAVSHRGAQGLMQLMPATVSRYRVADPFDPRANVDAGTRLLKSLLGVYDGDLSLALAAYNAGEEAVERYGRRVPPYPETRAYVEAVLHHLRTYGGAALEARR
jgi:hypothetical protein